MIKTIIDIPQFIFNLSPFLMGLIFWTITTILLAKSIKRHAKIYYWVFGILSFWGFISFFSQVFDLGLPKITSLPIFDQLFVEVGYAQYFIHPILVIIMMMGALSPKIKAVGRLMTIRKELSIIVGFPVLAHAIKRIILMVPSSWNFFANYEEAITSPRVVSVIGSAITNGVYLLGILMTILFLILWVTSFDSVHRKLGSQRWKRVQRWSYLLYAMLFIHAFGINTGSLISYNAREKMNPEITIEQTVAQPTHEMVKSSGHYHKTRFSLADVEIPQKTKYMADIIILIVVYGSYLYFRLRKANMNKKRKIQNNN